MVIIFVIINFLLLMFLPLSLVEWAQEDNLDKAVIAPQRCPHSNSWNLYLTWQGRIQVINGIKVANQLIL